MTTDQERLLRQIAAEAGFVAGPRTAAIAAAVAEIDRLRALEPLLDNLYDRAREVADGLEGLLRARSSVEVDSAVILSLVATLHRGIRPAADMMAERFERLRAGLRPDPAPADLDDEDIE
jgi:hypothetical protein